MKQSVDKNKQQKKQTVTVVTSHGNYEVIIGSQLHIGEELRRIKECCKVVVVSDDTVAAIYGQQCIGQLREIGYDVESFVFVHGEEQKNMKTACALLEFLAKQKMTRSDLLVALGGGVVGDLTGFVASIYLRGIDFVQIPTTVLSAVDASVGGKTAVDLDAGKNLAGAFYQPIGVFCDTSTFDTLPKEIYADGMAEVIKYGLIQDAMLFKQLEDKSIAMEDIVYRCVAIKAAIVKEDEFDNGIRRILNFGHTPGHAIEKLSEYQISHGSAVAIGMVMMTRLSENEKLCKLGATSRLVKLLQSYGLPLKTTYSAEELCEVALNDKKRNGKVLHLVLLDAIGNAVVKDISVDIIQECFEKSMDWQN